MSHGQDPMHTQQSDWSRSDEYHNSFLVKKDSDLEYTHENSQKAGLPDIGMSTLYPLFMRLK